MCPVKVVPFHSLYASPLNTPVLQRSWLLETGIIRRIEHSVLQSHQRGLLTKAKSAPLLTVANSFNIIALDSRNLGGGYGCQQIGMRERPVQGFDNQNGGRNGFDECHFGHAVVAERLENWTAKSLCVRNFRRSYALALWGKWRCREGVQIIGHVSEKLVIDCTSEQIDAGKCA